MHMRYTIALLAVLGTPACALPELLSCESYVGDVAQVKLALAQGYTIYAKTFTGVSEVQALLRALGMVSQEITPQELGTEPVTINATAARSIFAIASNLEPEVLLRFYDDEGCLYAAGQISLGLWTKAQLLI